ncbi:large subunit ribosomal protein L4 [Lewinella marina]|uniref:Large ribosomal subunit protein uL4 n=1 Tax=Neolewinella marina TaxID=438751 RepID=A0A2G0CHH4_9BACT|nr:50S ribosomal protein L4 [Neolewinella marina]NJB86106.1 large subunit ribosomal protein L4 [Neolewinella marina]PHK99416.1 50S ribosomal protein L4 [Neolewinella marina]
MKLQVHSATGAETGREVELPENIFGVAPNEHAVYLAVKAYLAAQRQGTHKAKERGEVAGSTKKLHKQKGTGGSRKGDIKNPLFRSGGRIFGPRPRTYGIKLNKRVKLTARASALSAKAAAGNIKLVEDLQFDAPKTKEFVKFLDAVKATEGKVLLITAENDANVFRSGRNLPNSTIVSASALNTYEVMRASTILIAEGAIDKLKEQFAAFETTTTNG